MKSKNELIVDLYENVCQRSNIDIISSGRYLITSIGYVGYLAKDIAKKLNLTKEDSLIDVGCNVGIYHNRIRTKVKYILGIDAGVEIIKKAQQKNKYSNVEYRVFNIVKDDWNLVDKKFNKALIYSVIHFFDNIDNVETLLRGLLQIMEPTCSIMLGEVRDTQLYSEFKIKQKTAKISLRNIKFKINKMINSFYLPPQKSAKVISVPCTTFDYKDINRLAAKLDLECTMMKQDKKHPFYNTSVDYILSRK